MLLTLAAFFTYVTANYALLRDTEKQTGLRITLDQSVQVDLEMNESINVSSLPG